MTYSKDELERSKKALEDAMETENYNRRVGEKRKREQEARDFSASQEGGQSSREKIEEDNADKVQATKAAAEVKESRRLNKDLVESGVKGYDTYATSMNMVIMSMLQDGKALRETYRPYSKMWYILKNIPHGVGVAGQFIGNTLRPVGQGIEDALGVHKQAGDRHLHRGNFNPHEMLEIGDEGQLSFRGSFGDIPGFEDIKGTPAEEDAKSFFMQSTYRALKDGGYACEKDKDTGEIKWTKKNEDGIDEPLTHESYEALFDDFLPTTLEEAYKADVSGESAPGYVYGDDDYDDTHDDDADRRFDFR